VRHRRNKGKLDDLPSRSHVDCRLEPRRLLGKRSTEPRLQSRDGRAARVSRSAQLAHVSAPVQLVELQPALAHQHAQRRELGTRLDDVHGHDRGPSGATDRQRRRHVRHHTVQPSARDRRQDGRLTVALSPANAGRHPHGPPHQSRRRALRRPRLHGHVRRVVALDAKPARSSGTRSSRTTTTATT
jgi:hypothetical protein